MPKPDKIISNETRPENQPMHLITVFNICTNRLAGPKTLVEW